MANQNIPEATRLELLRFLKERGLTIHECLEVFAAPKRDRRFADGATQYTVDGKIETVYPPVIVRAGGQNGASVLAWIDVDWPRRGAR